MNRRNFLAGIGMAGATGAFAGCIGGSSGANDSSGGNGSNDSSNGAETSNSENFIKRASFKRGKMFLHVDENVRRVRLIDPNGQKYASTKVGNSETSAKFTLIKVQAGPARTIDGYTPGTWKAWVDRKANGSYEEIGWAEVNLNPKIEPTKLEKVGTGSPAGGRVQVTFKNTGNAPGAVDAARIFARNHQPRSDSWTYPDEPIVNAGSTLTVATSLLGVEDQPTISSEGNASDFSGDYCTGETIPVYVEHRMFSDEPIRDKRTVVFSGKPVEGSVESQVECTKVSFQSSGEQSPESGTTNGSGS